MNRGDPLILFGQAVNDLTRLVRRTIVDKNQLQIWVGLIQQARCGRFNTRRLVTGWNQNRQLGQDI